PTVPARLAASGADATTARSSNRRDRRMPDAPPNIVYIHSHDTGRYIQPYGYAVKTPRLQEFAEQGVLFRNAFTVNPTCSPSRAALLCGTYPHENGMIGLAHRGARLNDPGDHLVATLNPAGYRTARVGVQHVAHGDGPWPAYDEVLETDGLNAASIVEQARAFVSRPHDKPFFLACGFFETHRYAYWHHQDDVGSKGDPRHVRPPAGLPDTERTRTDFADYAEAANELDGSMGSVIEAIDAAGLGDNTLVIVTTDHGLAFPGMKCSLSDRGQGVMLMMRGPGGFDGGRVLDPMVTHLDLFPTICGVAGIEAPARLRGKSLRPLVNGEVDRLHDATFGTVNFHAAYEPKRAIRTERYRYVKRLKTRSHAVLPNCDNSPSKDEWMAAGWADRPQAEESLYDLAFDPQEACNVAGDAAYADVLADLRGRLRAWREETNDPWLDGEPDCSHMRANPANGLNPGKADERPYVPEAD
ncbi:MAG: sulfatase, partial [Planctomycetota bacterium]